jgi:hypothetical protein
MKIPLINMIMFFVAIQAMLVVIGTHNIDQPATLFPDNMNASNYTSDSLTITGGYTARNVWEIVMFPQNGTGLGIIVMLSVMALGIVGISLLTRVDTGIWAPIFVLLLGLGSIPIMGLYNFLNSEVGAFACDMSVDPVTLLTPTCWPAEFGAMLVCGLLSMFWVWGCIGWWSNRYD